MNRTRYALDKNGNVVASPLPAPDFKGLDAILAPAPVVDDVPRDSAGHAIGNYL